MTESTAAPSGDTMRGFDAELADWLIAGDVAEVDDLRAQRLLRELASAVDGRRHAAGPATTTSPATPRARHSLDVGAGSTGRHVLVRALVALLPLAIGVGLGFAGYAPVATTASSETTELAAVEDPSVAPFLFGSPAANGDGAIP